MKKKYYQRPDGLFETSRTINGKRVRFRGKTCREVDQKILEYNAEQQHGRKVEIIADEWYWQHIEKISVSTGKVYRFAVKRIKDYFAGRPAGDVKPIDCQRYILNIESKGYAKNTVQIELSVLKQIFAHAVLSGDIDVSPATEVSHSRHLPKTTRKALTAEQERLVDECRSGDWWLLGMMLLYTGCRRGELLALTWQDIDRQAGVIHITKKINYAYGNTGRLENHLKSENGKRDIPLLAPLAAVLPRRRIGKIFTNKDGDYLTASQFGKVWQDYCRAAGLMEWQYNESGHPVEIPAITPHCFRHSFATLLYEAGIDPKAAAEFCGDTEQVIRDVYTDLRAGHRATSAEKINAYLAARQELKEG